jgi:glycerol-3-phosphate acyltransferase PlsX
MIRIAVDAMGGDHAPSAIVDGAVAAARHLDVRIALVGATSRVRAALDVHDDWQALGIEIVEAPDVIGMDEAPAAALRRKPGASIRVAAD